MCICIRAQGQPKLTTRSRGKVARKYKKEELCRNEGFMLNRQKKSPWQAIWFWKRNLSAKKTSSHIDDHWLSSMQTYLKHTLNMYLMRLWDLKDHSTHFSWWFLNVFCSLETYQYDNMTKFPNFSSKQIKQNYQWNRM